ncbi:ABC transporter [Spirochaetia bacterium]|nr:ABC transporter [Spirochaetia bacterium]
MVNLEVQSLSFSYGTTAILRDISFTMQGGELLGMLGKNGAGKSTLFRCVLGLEHAHTGKVFLDGRDIKTMKPAELAKLIAYVPQVHYPSFNYSALDMVLMGTAAQGKEWAMPNTRQRAAAAEALEQMGMSAFRDRGFRQLSGGEQQLVLIARALAQEARLLVMDEPTANLDYGNQIRVLLQIKALSRQGYSIILSTHNPDHAFLFTDRVLALHNNRLVASGTAAEVLTEELITELYGVPVIIRRDSNGVPNCMPVMPA